MVFNYSDEIDSKQTVNPDNLFRKNPNYKNLIIKNQQLFFKKEKNKTNLGKILFKIKS
jgi:hypothetical protein